ASTHGVKGLVKIIPYCDDLSLLKGPLYTSENPADNASLTITLKNSTGKYILASIEGITTPEDAKKLKCSLFVSRETLPNIEGEDTFYIEDLVGLTAKTHGHSDILGIIIAVNNFGAGDLLEIRPANGGESFYVPFHNDYVTNIDLEEKSVMLRNTELFRME
ncbi:MAG: 16S rRNA processing protein RimM, partial [Alphaproteobacteria bacterium]|nr:16S rRNA processing protein RimM [Alphaproteobacteria bacterium]